MSQEKWLFSIFLVLSIIAALSEGFSVSMIIPVLEAQGNNSAFANVPIVNNISTLFEGMDITTKLQYCAVLLAIVLLIRGFIQYSVDMLGSIIPLRLQRNLTRKSYSALINVDINYITEKEVGDLTNGLTGWIGGVTILLTSLATIIWNSLLLLMYLSFMVILSWKMTIIALVFVVFLSFCLKTFVSKPLRILGEKHSNYNAIMSNIIHETITGMTFIRQAVAEFLMAKKFNDAMNNVLSVQLATVKYQTLTFPFLTTSAGIFVCMMLYGGSYLYDGQENWLSGLLLFLFLIMRILGPISQINAARNRVVQHIYFLNMLDNFFKETTLKKQKSGDKEFKVIQNSITFDHVNFCYPQNKANVIDNLTMTIPAGKLTAVVGPSGAGKTTLISLLTRFYDVDKGSIKIDGENLNEFNIQKLREHTSIVSQDIFIFNDTVKNNISFALDNVTDEEIIMAAKLASAHEFINNMPEQYDTKLGDKGVRLSGGQKQRIAIARAILRKPTLLIMDEATSHLDTFTEKVIQDAVEELRVGRTVLVIAHRLSTIRKADKVIVLKNGSVAEEGQHDQLKQKKGIYWDMVQHQSLDLFDDED